MTPVGVDLMKTNGHIVYVEKNAGTGSGFEDASMFRQVPPSLTGLNRCMNNQIW